MVRGQRCRFGFPMEKKLLKFELDFSIMDMNHYRDLYRNEMNKTSFGRIKRELSTIFGPAAFDMEFTRAKEGSKSSFCHP
jgi:hypothetical protein